MPQTPLAATTGRATGSPASRRLRAEGHIPGVLYGHGMSPISVTIERRELRLALSGAAGANTVLDLQVDGKSYPARDMYSRMYNEGGDVQSLYRIASL